MKNWKIVFCDIDGTLITDRYQVTHKTKVKIQALVKKGIPFILTSGRKPSSIYSVQQEIGIRGPIIAYSGALTLDESGHTLRDVHLPLETALAIKEENDRRYPGLMTSLFSYDRWITDDANHPAVLAEIAATHAIPETGPAARLLEGCPVHKVLCMGDAFKIKAAEESLKARYPQYAICRSLDSYLEIMGPEANKSGGAAALCGSLGFSMADAVSFGDNYNDMDLLKATGIGYAMGNAPQGVKEKADFITEDHNHEGVLRGLERLFDQSFLYSAVNS